MSGRHLYLNLISGVAFALICADYARFIDLPQIVTIPAWAVFVLNMLRWAVWEGMIKPGRDGRITNG